MSTVGSRIREAREAKGWTQDDLAKRLETSRTLVSSWEGDKTVPRGTTRLKIATALDVANEWLRTGEGPRNLTLPSNVTMKFDNVLGGNRLVDEYILPAQEVTEDYLRGRGIELGEGPLAKVVLMVVLKAMHEGRTATDADVSEALVRVIQGD